MPIILVPIGLVIYCLLVILIFGFWCWFFDKPQEWDWFIPITTSMMSLGGTNGFLEEKFKSPTSGVIVAGLVVAFWVIFVFVDIFGTVSSFVTGDFRMDNVDVLMFYLDKLLNSKIFAVVSAIIFLGIWDDYKKELNKNQ